MLALARTDLARTDLARAHLHRTQPQVQISTDDDGTSAGHTAWGIRGMLVYGLGSMTTSKPQLSEQLKQGTVAQKTANVVSTDHLRNAAQAAGVPAAETEVLVHTYAESQLTALRAGLAGAALFALVALVYVRRFPTDPLPISDETLEATGAPAR